MNKEEHFITYEEASILENLVKRYEEDLVKTKPELTKYKMAYDILKRIVNYGYIDPEYGIFDSSIYLSEEEEEYVISLIDKENK